MTPRVAVCVPSMSTWSAHMATAHTDICLYSAMRGIAILPLGLQCSLITSARNKLVRAAREYDATHLLWMDSDMTAPMDALERLLAHEKDVVGAFYSCRTPPYKTIGRLVGDPDVSKGGLYEATALPGGFVLVNRDVYEKLSPPWYFESYDENEITESEPDGHVGEDYNFCRSCVTAGIKLFCDADLTFQVKHVAEIQIPCLPPEPKPEISCE